MSADADDTGQPRRRRSSIAELFASRPLMDPSSAQGQNIRPLQSSTSASVTQQAQQPHARRLSITTLGLSGSPTQPTSTTPFGALKRTSVAGPPPGRRGSVSSSDEAIADEEPGPLGGPPDGSRPTGRRLSFGAKAYRDIRASVSGAESSSDATSPSISSKGSSPPSSRGAEGFNWSDNLLNRAKRTSISAAAGFGGTGPQMPSVGQHPRANTIAAGQQPARPEPIKAALAKPPDHFQERILKGDFYMD